MKLKPKFTNATWFKLSKSKDKRKMKRAASLLIKIFAANSDRYKTSSLTNRKAHSLLVSSFIRFNKRVQS